MDENLSASCRRDFDPAPGDTVAGFTVERVEDVADVDARAYVMRHASGARLLYLACDDENKAFAIGFKTPPADDTGVFHILEHSVLCGSRRYPVKEPFVDLIKSSMQTFLNAMTYPDKTVYPVASTNEQDLLNLMDVYMDAVLDPAIYEKPTIFHQEGWHYEIAADKDGNPLPDAPLTYNGVVFNEMKGALSDPLDVLDEAVMRALFPDTAYAHESGGHPRAIPTLTYERFLDAHARHYTLENSRIVLYGNMDARRVLEHLDRKHLSCAPDRAAGAPNPLERQAPRVCDYERVEMATTPENASVAVAYVLGDALDVERVIAADVLFEAILGSNEAPVKRAVLDSGLGGDMVSYTSSACLQPYELIVLRNAREDSARAFRALVEGECRKLVEGGIPRERLEATISSNEFDLRQRDYGTADGVVLALGALSTWLYAEDEGTGSATLGLKYEDIFAKLRRELDTGYFERLLAELVLESGHSALVELAPVEQDGETEEEAELAAARASMDEEALAQVIRDVELLRAAQEAPDTPEQKATLPRLSRADIGGARPEPMLTVDTTAPVPTLKHAIPTRQLAYALTYFDISHLSYDELPYVTLLARFMQRLDTEARTAAELDSHIKSNLGFLSFSTEVYSPENPMLARPKLVVAAGALSEKVGALATIPAEVWSTTRFEDVDRMRDICTQLRIALEQGFVSSGHAAAMARARSYTSPAAVVREKLAGVDFYLFLRDLLDNFDERAPELADRLRDLQERIFTSTGTVESFTGSDEDYRRFWEAAGTLGLAPRRAAAKELYVPAPEDKHEAFVIPSDVCYCAQAHDPRLLGIATDGAWSVAANALSYDYLWNEVRVKGGAYGCGFRVAVDRQLAFYSYRDPAVDPTLARFAAAGSWLGSFDPSPEAFDGFVISCAAAHDAPLKPFALARRQDTAYFSKRPASFREDLRRGMLEATPQSVAALGEQVSAMAKAAPVCVFGGRDIVERSEADFNVVDLLG